jgi:hypothetical protein
MARSNVLDRLLKKLTPEKLEEMKQKRIEEKNKLTTEYQLGYYVGEDIVNRFLPSISVEPGTRTQIEVSEEESIEYARIEKKWYNKYQQGKDEATEEWNYYQNYRELLKKKYLPSPLICHMSPLNIVDLEEFKKGLIWSLWDSDHCNYCLDTEKIKIYDDEEIYFTIIEFELY